MTETITLKLTFEELKQIDKYVEINDETRPLFDKIRNAYPKPETLLDVIRNLGYSYDCCYEIVDAVEEFEKSKEPEKWDIKVETDYLTGKARHKWNIVDKDGNDYKPEPITTEELLKPKTPEEPEPEMLLLRQGKVDIVDYNHRTHYRIEYTDSFSGVYKWFVRKLGEVAFLEEIRDVNNYAPLEELYQKEVMKQKEEYPYKKYTPEENEWKSVALRFGEKLSGYLSDGYYELSPAAWFRWAVFTYGKGQQMKDAVRESVKWCEEHPDKDPLDCLKPQTPEQVADGLKKAFREAQQTEKWKETQKLIDEEDNDKNFKNSLDLIREWGEKNKPPTLYQLIEDWWCDIFCANSTDDMETCIDGLVNIIDKKFIPPSHDTNDYQWNKCLKIMRDKLR